MSASDNLCLFEEYIAAFNAHDAVRVATCYSADAVNTEYGSRILRGQIEIKDFHQRIFEARPDYRARLVDILAGDDRVYADVEYSGTFTGPYRGPDETVVQPNGRAFKCNAIIRASIRNGKIAELFLAMNELDFRHQLDLPH